MLLFVGGIDNHLQILVDFAPLKFLVITVNPLHLRLQDQLERLQKMQTQAFFFIILADNTFETFIHFINKADHFLKLINSPFLLVLLLHLFG